MHNAAPPLQSSAVGRGSEQLSILRNMVMHESPRLTGLTFTALLARRQVALHVRDNGGVPHFSVA